MKINTIKNCYHYLASKSILMYFSMINIIVDMILEYSLSHYAIMKTKKALVLVLYVKKGCVVVFQIIIRLFEF